MAALPAQEGSHASMQPEVFPPVALDADNFGANEVEDELHGTSEIVVLEDGGQDDYPLHSFPAFFVPRPEDRPGVSFSKKYQAFVTRYADPENGLLRQAFFPVGGKNFATEKSPSRGLEYSVASVMELIEENIASWEDSLDFSTTEGAVGGPRSVDGGSSVRFDHAPPPPHTPEDQQKDLHQQHQPEDGLPHRLPDPPPSELAEPVPEQSAPSAAGEQSDPPLPAAPSASPHADHHASPTAVLSAYQNAKLSAKRAELLALEKRRSEFLASRHAALQHGHELSRARLSEIQNELEFKKQERAVLNLSTSLNEALPFDSAIGCCQSAWEVQSRIIALSSGSSPKSSPGGTAAGGETPAEKLAFARGKIAGRVKVTGSVLPDAVDPDAEPAMFVLAPELCGPDKHVMCLCVRTRNSWARVVVLCLGRGGLCDT